LTVIFTVTKKSNRSAAGQFQLKNHATVKFAVNVDTFHRV